MMCKFLNNQDISKEQSGQFQRWNVFTVFAYEQKYDFQTDIQTLWSTILECNLLTCEL